MDPSKGLGPFTGLGSSDRSAVPSGGLLLVSHRRKGRKEDLLSSEDPCFPRWSMMCRFSRTIPIKE